MSGGHAAFCHGLDAEAIRNMPIDKVLEEKEAKRAR
jgi:hypothetical protein